MNVRSASSKKSREWVHWHNGGREWSHSGNKMHSRIRLKPHGLKSFQNWKGSRIVSINGIDFKCTLSILGAPKAKSKDPKVNNGETKMIRDKVGRCRGESAAHSALKNEMRVEKGADVTQRTHIMDCRPSSSSRNNNLLCIKIQNALIFSNYSSKLYLKGHSFKWLLFFILY